MISRSRAPNKSRFAPKHGSHRQPIFQPFALSSLIAGMAVALAASLVGGTARYPSSAFAQSASGPSNGYDRSRDVWRPEEPSGNAFDQQLEDDGDPAGVARNIPPRAAQDDGLVVRDLSEPALPGSEGLAVSQDAWRGLDRSALLELAGKLPYPIASPTLAGLFRALMIDENAPQSDTGLKALRAELLYRSGMVDAVTKIGRPAPSDPAAAIVQVTQARALLALGKRREACKLAEDIDRNAKALARQSRRDLFSLVALCYAADRDTEGARRIMNEAQQAGVAAPVPLAIVDMLAASRKPNAPIPQKLKLLDYAFLKLAKARAGKRVVELAEPALLSSLVRAPDVSADVRSMALDRAIIWSALPASDVEKVVREITERVRTGKSVGIAEILSRGADLPPDTFRNLARDLDAPSAAFLLAPLISDAATSAAETMNRQDGLPDKATFGAIIKLLVAANELTTAQRLVQEASRKALRPDADIDNWLTLINIADADTSAHRKAGLAASASLARRGLMRPATMDRLVTILDALGYNVPIPLWEAANRAQPKNDGFLPATGILTSLRDASRKRQQGRTVLLAMTAIGKDGPAKASAIALSDTIRALRRVGLEAAARRLAVEALWPVWPGNIRQTANSVR